jgi:hypothetical protein
MRAAEILLENVSDTRDIHMASQWLADSIIKHDIPVGKVFTAHSIFKMDGGDTLPIDQGPVAEILLDDELMFVIGNSMKSKRGTITNGSFFPGKNTIWINRDLIRKGAPSLASTIGHEIRHALDFALSGGAPFRKKRDGRERGSTTDQYLRDPQEINARFTQAMWAMAFDSIEKAPRTAHDALGIINDALYRLRLSRDLFPAGPKGDQQYNRLRSRAIRYWMEVARFFNATETASLPKKTIMDRIRGIISRFRLG